MSGQDIPEGVKNFIFQYIDSVEVLEIILLFCRQPDVEHSVAEVAAELRSNPTSTSSKIEFLHSIGILEKQVKEKTNFIYKPQQSPWYSILQQLESVYRIQKHRVLELIFSPHKRARDFADAFKRGGGKSGTGRDDA